MTEKELDAIKEVIIKTVNGKIDVLRAENNNVMSEIKVEIATHNINHEEDMKDLKPIIEAWKTSQSAGRGIIKTATVIGILGGPWLMLKQIFPFL